MQKRASVRLFLFGKRRVRRDERVGERGRERGNAVEFVCVDQIPAVNNRVLLIQRRPFRRRHRRFHFKQLVDRVQGRDKRAPVVVTADAVRVAAWKVALAVAAPLMLAFVLAALVLPRRRD